MASSAPYNPLIYKAILSIAAAAVLLGIFFRLHHLDRKTFWGDEILGLIHTLGYTEADIVLSGPRIRTAGDVQVFFHLGDAGHAGARPLTATVRSLAEEDPQHPPVYYLMTRLWAGFAGVAPAALRTLPAVFGILSIGAMAWLGFELFRSARGALIAASLYALSPFAVLYSQEARESSLWALEVLALSALMLRAARTECAWHWFAYGAIAAISLYTNPLTALVMAAHAAVIAASPALWKRPVLIPYLLASAGASLVFLPWLSYLVPSATSASGPRDMGTLLANKPSAAGVALTFMRDIKATMVDIGAVYGRLSRLALSSASVATFAAVLYALARLIAAASRETAARFILALFFVPAIPFVLIHGGALAGQVRYFGATYLAIPLALTAWFHAAFGNEKAGRFRVFVAASSYLLVLLCSGYSCLVSARAGTWYNKAYQRTPEVAAIVNQSARPLVVGDRTIVNDRGTSRVLELAYYLRPEVAMRANLRCDGCQIPAPAPIDVFADAGQFRNVFVLGKLARPIPEGSYDVRLVGIDVHPIEHGPLEMFAGYPRW